MTPALSVLEKNTWSFFSQMVWFTPVYVLVVYTRINELRFVSTASWWMCRYTRSLTCETLGSFDKREIWDIHEDFLNFIHFNCTCQKYGGTTSLYIKCCTESVNCLNIFLHILINSRVFSYYHLELVLSERQLFLGVLSDLQLSLLGTISMFICVLPAPWLR